MEGIQVIGRKFVVNETPYCAWEVEFPLSTLDYLNQLDPMYFVYARDVHVEKLETEDKLRAAIALKTIYVQSLETLFALLFASLQAPYCVRGWLIKYTNKDLRDLIIKVNSNKPILTLIYKERTLSWADIANTILYKIRIPEDEVEENRIKQSFADLWAFLAREYIDEKLDREYNSIKHGLRVNPGGFTFSVRLENNDPEWVSLGTSDFGSGFPVSEPLRMDKDRINFKIRQQLMNSTPEYLCKAIEAICWSLKNIIGFLRDKNRDTSTQIEFILPTDKDFIKDLQKLLATPGVTHMSGINFNGNDPAIIPCTKEDVLSLYKNKE